MDKEKVLAVLKFVEWNAEYGGHYYCPYCEENKEIGHKEECKLKECIEELLNE